MVFNERKEKRIYIPQLILILLCWWLYKFIKFPGNLFWNLISNLQSKKTIPWIWINWLTSCSFIFSFTCNNDIFFQDLLKMSNDSYQNDCWFLSSLWMKWIKTWNCGHFIDIISLYFWLWPGSCNIYFNRTIFATMQCWKNIINRPTWNNCCIRLLPLRFPCI